MKSTLLYISLLVNVLGAIAILVALNKFGGWGNLWSKINNRGIEKTYLHRKNLFEMLPQKDSSIVFLGNSLTAYGEWAEYYENNNIVNRGIPGDHCDGVRERLDEIVKLHPRKIFLLIGVNDLAYHPPEIVFAKYEHLLQAMLKKMPTSTIYVQTLFPVNNEVSPTPVSNADVRTLNQGIKQLALTYQVPVIDLYPLLVDANGNLGAGYTLDGIHLNGVAYLKWAEFLSSKVNENC